MSDKTVIIEIEIFLKDLDDILNNQELIYQCIANKKSIPYTIAKEYFGALRNKQSSDSYRINKEIHIVKHYVLEKYSGEYNFVSKLRTISESTAFKCNFQNLITYLFGSFRPGSFQKDRDYIIERSYEAINKFFDHFKGDTTKVFSNYKRIVLCGYIAYKLGFSLSKEINELEDEEPTNAMLNQAVKYRINQIKKKSRQKN